MTKSNEHFEPLLIKCVYGFVGSVALLLAATASAKVISAFGSSVILELNDPVIGIPNQYLLQGAAAIELVLICLIVFARQNTTKLLAIAWLATALCVYRLGLSFAGGARCPCLGTIGDNLHISESTLDGVMIYVLVYMFLGSVVLLFLSYRYTPTLRTKLSLGGSAE